MGVKKRKTATEFALNASEIHNDKYDYSKVIYTNRNNKVIITCPIHGDFEQTPNGHLKGYGCYACGRNKTKTTEDDFIKKAKEVHGDLYDYTNINYSGALKPVTIKCPLHGVFEQKANNHINGSGCKQCSLDKISSDFSDNTDTFIEKSKLVHGNKYDYSKVDYVDNRTKVKIICSTHGEFEQLPSNHKNGHRCPLCTISKGEEAILEFLLENEIVFTPQHRFKDCRDKRPLPFDFYLPKYNTCIEYNGRQHYEVVEKWGGTIGLKDRQKKDGIKIKYCQDKKINLISIKHDETDILKNIKAMLT
jgi:transposase-like protein